MMKREIKFRAWNGETMNYNIIVGRFGAFWVNPGIKNNGLDERDSASLTPFNTKCAETTIVMQFSEEKDNNAVDIYEGDILLFGNGEKSVVKWSQGGLVVEADFGDYELTTVGWAIEYLDGCKVIGNVHENADMLN